MKKISVIIPVYNAEKYLSNCIISVLNQTYSYFELILVDDGSTDKSGIICEKFKNSDNRIKVIHKKNGGVSTARNIGIEESNGDYLIFIDSDDSVDKNLLNDLVVALEELEVETIIHSINFNHNKNISKINKISDKYTGSVKYFV